MTINVIKNSTNNSVRISEMSVGKTFTWGFGKASDLFIVTNVIRTHEVVEVDTLNLSKNGTKCKFAGNEGVIPVDIEIKIL